MLSLDELGVIYPKWQIRFNFGTK